MIESPNYLITLCKIMISRYFIQPWDSWHLLGRNPLEMHCFPLCSSYNLCSLPLMLMFWFNRTHPFTTETSEGCEEEFVLL